MLAHFNRAWCKNDSRSFLRSKDPTNADVKLMVHSQHINFNDDWMTGNCEFENAEGELINDFCIDVLEDGTYTAEMCEKIPLKYR